MTSRRRKFWSRVTSGFDITSSTHNPTPPPPLLPNVSTTSNSITPSGGLVGAGPETDSSATIQINTTNRRGEASSSPSIPSLTGNTGKPVQLLQHAIDSNSKLTLAPPAPPHTPEVASNMSTATCTIPAPSANKDSWVGLKTFFRVINQNASLFGPLRVAVGELITCTEVYERVASDREEFKTLKAELEDLFGDLKQYFSHSTPPTITASMECLCKLIVEELGYMKGKQDRGRIRQYLEAGEGADRVLACYRRIQGYLQRISLNANLSMWKIVDEQTTSAGLDRLCPSLSACYNSRQATGLKRISCTEGTRVDILDKTYRWVHDHVAGSVYWLNGMAGTGKTTIAYSLCEELEASNNLGASFFCSRLLPECRDVNQIVPSIAYQLARFSRPFRSALWRVLESERDAHTQLLHVQFQALIIKPLVEVRDTLPRNLVVVIDALDECDDKKGTGQILEVLLTKTRDLPLKFFIASRPEPGIRDQMRKQGYFHDLQWLVLHELDKCTVQGDITTYLRAALQPVEPSESDIAALVQRAGILFIYAATVARYIGYDNFGRNPRSRLKTILSISASTGAHAYKEIDELYRIILQEAIDDPELDDQERDDMRQVLNTVLCAREPVTIATLSELLDLDDVERIHAALRPLWSVLHVVESDGLVTTLHASFPDYMFDPERSKSYHCDQAAHEQILALCCLNHIKSADPQFNICGLESSYRRDREIHGLSTRIQKAISPVLSYACQYWATHLKHARWSRDLIEGLGEFLSTQLLLWMEIMNLKQCMNAGVGVIRQAEEWCIRQGAPKDITELALDAWRFVAAFTVSPVSQSTPHIYVSMLPFWPECNPISINYSKRMRVQRVPQGSAIARRRLELLATWKLDRAASGVAWSLDGTRIAIATGGQVFLWDAATGRSILGPLQLNSGPVQSVGLSPDGTCIVAGSVDGTIVLWDTRNGETMAGPLEGHTNRVRSVAFSPDGTRFISGSDDHTIFMWDAGSGRTVLGPLKGHSGAVTCVAFSPDGTRIVTGSDDCIIRMWDVKTGRMAASALKHADWVRSLACSPDGTRIVSSSYGNDIHMWDARRGKLALEPLKGHTQSVASTAFSPDGNHIISGSDDCTIRMWDARSGQTVLGPLQKHTNRVTCVTFSPDGTRILSCSDDDTIRVWDARSRKTVFDSPEAHTWGVTSVAFSPDNTRILSGDSGGMVHMWDAYSGQNILGPLEGPTPAVTSVAFSPDGTRIVAGSDNKIHIWDARSGKTVLGPFADNISQFESASLSSEGTSLIARLESDKPDSWHPGSRPIPKPLRGHTPKLESYALSPNKTLVAGTVEEKIALWNPGSGPTASTPLQSFTFLPSRAHIASGSEGNKFRSRDTHNESTLINTFRSRTHRVQSVAFSPDSTRITSGYDDSTILVWDACDGQKVLGPLEGHTDSVTSITFSPNGTQILSGSDDCTIRIWNASTGQWVLGPLQGHTYPVKSVAFSSDSINILSGSDDCTIRMWDARSGMMVLGPLRGHTHPVKSVTFSPDGTHILSGSDDCTIRMWDSQSGQMVLGPLKGHNGAVTSVAFSPNGTRILSGSDDCTIRIWDAQTEEKAVLSSGSGLVTPSSWNIHADGWLIDHGNNPRMLLWVPLDVHRVLLPHPQILKISSHESVGLNFVDASIGESWADCYCPG